ncbi:uncharacterized protein LOC135926145 isoform X2 [Gordionus sp. m RMFG-2023]|uniref:uncharacterized protein LOC135926145 isoform X2 n=1 Tax=Gordionus sp. m RMFG-2023 TaxID=3053472 RepID=UPI0031FBD173
MNNLVKKKFNRKKLKKMIDKKDNRKNVIPAINPFDRHFIRKKSNVSKSKHVSTIPKAEEKRKKTLLQEYKKRNNTNKLIDYRIGEKVDISQDEKTLQRLIREKQKQSKKRLYNLNDEELTHTGIKLSEMKSYKNVTDLDMENDGDHNSKIVSSLHFGGFENSSKELNHLNKSKHKTFLEEMISFSKKEKHEKQREKENIDTFREKLDQTWKELRMLIKSDSKINHIDSTKNNQLDTKKSIGKISNDYSYGVESYDLIYHDLQFQSSNNSEVIQREDNSKPVDSNIKKTVSKDENKNSYKKTQIRTYSADALTYDECLNIQPKLTNQFPISDGREEPFILAYDESGKMWLLYRLVTNSSLLSPKSNHPQTLNYIITNLLDILLKITNTQLSFYANSAIKYPKQNYVQYITNLLGLSLCKSLMYNFNQVDIHSGITDKSDNFHCRAMYFPVLSEYLSGSQNYYIRSLPFCLGAKNNDTKIKDDYNDILLLDILYMPLYEKTFKLSLCNYFKILLKFVSLYDYKEVELSNAISTTNSGLLSSFPEIIKPLIDTLQNKLVPLLDEDYEIKQTTEKIIVKSSDISQKISHKRSSLLSISPEHLVQYFNPLHKTDPINNKCKPKVPNLLEPLIIPANNKFNTKKGGKMKNLAKELIMNDEALKKQGLNNNEKDKIHRTRAKHLLDQRQMLKHVYKRDMKTAKKELRKDATFLSNQKLNEQIERDMIRKTKVKKLYSFLANQEGEVRALKRKKK